MMNVTLLCNLGSLPREGLMFVVMFCHIGGTNIDRRTETARVQAFRAAH